MISQILQYITSRNCLQDSNSADLTILTTYLLLAVRILDTTRLPRYLSQDSSSLQSLASNVILEPILFCVPCPFQQLIFSSNYRLSEPLVIILRFAWVLPPPLSQFQCAINQGHWFKHTGRQYDACWHRRLVAVDKQYGGLLQVISHCPNNSRLTSRMPCTISVIWIFSYLKPLCNSGPPLAYHIN